MGNCCDKLCLRHLMGTNVIYLFDDKMPHKDQVHLPSWKTQKDVYHQYIGDMTRRGISEEEVAGISIFYKVWTRNSPMLLYLRFGQFCVYCYAMVAIELGIHSLFWKG